MFIFRQLLGGVSTGTPVGGRYPCRWEGGRGKDSREGVGCVGGEVVATSWGEVRAKATLAAGRGFCLLVVTTRITPQARSAELLTRTVLCY